MKTGQLLDYNLISIFLENHTQNVVEEPFPYPFLKNQNWAYFWINILKFYMYIYIFCLASWGLLKVIETKLQTTCFTWYKAFLKNKRGLELVFLPHFLRNFGRKIFLLYSITWPNFNVWLPLLREILGNMCIAIVCQPGCDIINFDI